MITKLILDICKMILFLIFFTSLSYSKDNTGFEIFYSPEGQSQNSIICITQDSRCFLFFGKSEGLNRYDGYQFKIFINVADDFLLI